MSRNVLSYTLAACLSFSVLTKTSTNGAESWTGFRNEGNTSIEAQGLPVTWSPDDAVAWKIELPGYGQSSPVIWKDFAYLTATEGENKDFSKSPRIACGQKKRRLNGRRRNPITVAREMQRTKPGDRSGWTRLFTEWPPSTTPSSFAWEHTCFESVVSLRMSQARVN